MISCGPYPVGVRSALQYGRRGEANNKPTQESRGLSTILVKYIRRKTRDLRLYMWTIAAFISSPLLSMETPFHPQDYRRY